MQLKNQAINQFFDKNLFLDKVFVRVLNECQNLLPKTTRL